ncbi:MAG: 5'-3' exonuclease H3TH domain-containing protein [Stenotrophomonas maltophilia]
MKIHLVDGTYELFRAYFAQPSRQAPHGREVGAVRGLMQTLLALLRQEDVTHVAIAFDHVVKSFRNELFAGYKTGEGTPEDLTAQFDLAEQASQALGLVVWPMTEFEADDALASAAHRWGDDPAVEQVVICTPDKDLAQMVRGQQVVCLDRRREQTLDEAGVHLKFGVAPASIPDYLALVGDAADGIPGIPRWGAKSTGAVLARYFHLEQIPDNANFWDVKVRGAAAIAASLAERREEARLYRELATLRLNVPLAESLDQLEWKGVRRPGFQELCAELGITGISVPKPPG